MGSRVGRFSRRARRQDFPWESFGRREGHANARCSLSFSSCRRSGVPRENTHRSISARSMIVSRTPFRVTLGGGGTDLPGFYEQYGGYVLALGIDKYMYI